MFTSFLEKDAQKAFAESRTTLQIFLVGETAPSEFPSVSSDLPDRKILIV